jgi:MFS superfamily sulfate permease-like transporter
MGGIILSFIVGMWVAAVLSYLMVIKQMIEENDELKEIIHQQTKIGFYEELKQDEYE